MTTCGWLLLVSDAMAGMQGVGAAAQGGCSSVDKDSLALRWHGAQLQAPATLPHTCPRAKADSGRVKRLQKQQHFGYRISGHQGRLQTL